MYQASWVYLARFLLRGGSEGLDLFDGRLSIIV